MYLATKNTPPGATRNEMPMKGNTKVTSTNAWEAILNYGKRGDANCFFQGGEEQHLEPGPAPEDKHELLAPALQEMIVSEVKSQVADALAAVSELVGEAVVHLFRAPTLSAQGGSPYHGVQCL